MECRSVVQLTCTGFSEEIPAFIIKLDMDEVSLKRQHTSTKLHCVIFTLLGCYVSLIGNYRLLMRTTGRPATSVVNLA